MGFNLKGYLFVYIIVIQCKKIIALNVKFSTPEATTKVLDTGLC